ncbi:hypothetical protein ACRW9N_10995 [Listeria aquatica]|uniref:hypothetical protein n=1 Tax=Listeria aquatica TaxID=1494960 RepID=UPI003EF8EDC0
MTDKKRSPQKEIVYQFQKIKLKQKALHHVQEGTKEQLQAFRKIQEQDIPHVEKKLADVERELHIEGYFHEEVAILCHPIQRLIQEAEEKLMAYQGELEILEQEEDRLLKEAKEMEQQLKMDN